MNARLEVLALVLGFLGLVGTVAVTAMPHADVRTQCKVYDSLLILTPDLQAARALTSVSVGVATGALLVAFCGGGAQQDGLLPGQPQGGKT
ncbi:unnamed protein product [Arctogadus glacialis]